MQPSTYRIDLKRILIAGCLLAVVLLFITACRKKDVAATPPEIVFVTDSGYTSHDTVLVAGAKIRVGIRAHGSEANITYFSIRYNNGSPKVILDTGMNRPSLNYTVEIIKTSSAVEKWTFFIMDRNRQKDSVNVILTKSDYSKWGKIITLGPVTLGAQSRTDTGSFYSFNTGEVYTLDQAYLNQDKIDLIYYYGLYEGTFASPSEAEAPGFFTGPEGIVNWSVKNETRYDTTLLSTADFDAAINDSLLLSAYDPSAGKRKAKFLQPGMVVAFKSPAGKLGLIKVNGVKPNGTGEVNFFVKIQE